MKAIKERELENQYNESAKVAKEKVEQIKKKAAAEVAAKRNHLKEKIMEMRKNSQRQEKILHQRFLQMKMEMTQKMQNIYKFGDSKKCSTAMSSPQDHENYCVANFSDDVIKFDDCKESDDICKICCINEYGDIHAPERSKCAKELCEKTKDKKKSEDGRWVWQTPINTTTD